MYRTYGQQDDLGLRVDRAGRTVSKAAGQASLEPKAREQAMEEDQSGKGGQVLLFEAQIRARKSGRKGVRLVIHGCVVENYFWSHLNFTQSAIRL